MKLQSNIASYHTTPRISSPALGLFVQQNDTMTWLFTSAVFPEALHTAFLNTHKSL